MKFSLKQGTRTLIHPNVKIIAQAGPIFIGENNLIEEQTIIINKYTKGLFCIQ